MADTIITRPGFCPECYKAEHMKTGHPFYAFGNNGPHYREALHCSHSWGYVPHTFKLYKKLGENIIVFRACSVLDCPLGSEILFTPGRYESVETNEGVKSIYIQPKNEIYIPDKNYKRVIYTRQQWEILILNPWKGDNDFYV